VSLVCLGDSLTQGTIGAAYIDRLRAALPAARIINAGVNGDTVLHLLRRVPRDVTPHHPHAVLVLVGLNDFGTVYGEPTLRAYYRTVKRVHVQITVRRFAAAYRALIERIRADSGAQIAVCTLTTYGERLADPTQPYLDAYSHAVRALAVQEQVALIDLRAAFVAAIRAEERHGPPYRIWTPLRDLAQIGVRRGSYAALQARRGFRLVVDGVHLSAAGADLAAATMLPVIRQLIGS
jgi:lysophospholipase L1-like esterase